MTKTFELMAIANPNGEGEILIRATDYDPSVHVLPGAIAAVEPSVVEPVESVDRKAELEAMSWQRLKAIAEDMELPDKPDGVSWQEYAIPLILELEGV